MTGPAKFKPGDKVRLRDQNQHRNAWTVVAEDTNRTPVRDPEPAYQLRNGGAYDRYAYESDIEAVAES